MRRYMDGKAGVQELWDQYWELSRNHDDLEEDIQDRMVDSDFVLLDDVSAYSEKWLSNFQGYEDRPADVEVDSVLDGVEANTKAAVTESPVEADETNGANPTNALKVKKDLETHLESIFNTDDLQKDPYRLYAVTIHSGTSSGGHYVIYIRDFQNDTWRRYSDTEVKNADSMQDIIYATTSTRETSTTIFYVQEDRIADLTQPLCRHIPMTDVEPDSNGLSNLSEGMEVIDGVEMDTY
jgi:hypothetical protein